MAGAGTAPHKIKGDASVQTPAPFTYERAATVDEALGFLARYGPEARLVAGGHSLIPMMKLRLARPEALIDINGLTDLDYIRLDGDDIAIGAMTRHHALLDSALLAEHYRIFADAERVIADPIVRNRGTIGGSICQADPSEDLSAVFAALKAQAVIRSSSGERVVGMDDFHQGPYTTSVGPAEILTEVRVKVRPSSGSAYEKVERRVGDWAVVAAGALLSVEGGLVTEAGIGLAAVGAEHFRAGDAEASLVGGPADDGAFARAGALAAEECHPVGDQRGPEDYKRHLVRELTVRALRRAAARAQGREG
jgi:carbon-monoxide dehydrogenase medium subunit